MEEEEMDILKREIELWARFGYALREDNRILFHQMLDKCRKSEYFECVNAKGDNYSAESLFLILILEQQKMINELLERFETEEEIKNAVQDHHYKLEEIIMTPELQNKIKSHIKSEGKEVRTKFHLRLLNTRCH